MRKSRVTVAMIGVAAVVSPTAATALGEATPLPTAPTDTPPLPKTTADGWIHYDDELMSSRLGLSGTTSTDFPGNRADDGTCLFTDKQTAAPGSTGVFSEDVAFNPTSCDRIVQTSPLTPAAATALSQLALDDQPLPSLNGRSSGSPTPELAYGPAGSHKSAWIDPFNITITSLAADAAINYGFPNEAQVYPYTFPYDGWSGGPHTKQVTNYDNDPFQVTGSVTRVNSDFSIFVINSLGLSAWLACGAPLSPEATFRHYDVADVYKNGAVSGADSDSKSGACSNLVHHSSWTLTYFQY